MYYWFTHGKHTFPAGDREAWTLYSKKTKSTYHGATDGEIYRNALNANKLERFKIDKDHFDKPDHVKEQEESLQIAINEAIKQEIERADKNIIPKNMDTKIGSSVGTPPSQSQINAVKGMVG